MNKFIKQSKNQSPIKANTLEGQIKRHPDGFGFFIPDNSEHPDVYIPKHSMEGVMTQDRVLITVEKERGGPRFRGEIVKILSRGAKQIVGVFTKINEQYGVIKDEGKGWGEDLRIKLEDSMQAKNGELVAATITQFPEEDKKFSGRVVQVIGNIADPLNDIKRVIIGNGIPHEFSPAVLEEAKKFSANPSEADFKGRKDLRGIDIITIDGATAKDFDDAVYVENSQQGFHLFVAIADVSHYVRPGTAMDTEAYERGTSVYFPNFVVPMLPEALSNGLCSLNPNVPRLALVADMHFSYTGEMTESSFYEAVIQSKARVTYGEAQEVIDGVQIEKLNHVKENILRCADLAKLLMAKRFREGSLDLEIPETELEIDSTGTPVDVIKSERLFSHRLIEELMLAANVAVAKFLGSREITSLYRIHEPPNEKALATLSQYMHNFGGQSSFEGGKLQKKLTRALQDFEGKPEAQILNILTLRSMSQAKYSTNNLGHFGLGFDFYTHFTSPIRRYPDLIVHRLIKSQVMPRSDYQLISEEELQTAGTILSAAEQRSAKAERQIHSIKKARFMEKHVGEVFEGIISSVTRFGLFVLLRQYDIDGLIRLEDLGPEKWEYDEEQLRLVGQRSGFAYNIGDPITIQVTSCDHELGQINFSLEKTAARSAHKQNRKERHKESSSQGYKESSTETRRENFRGGGRERDLKGKKQKDFFSKDKGQDQRKNKPSKRNRDHEEAYDKKGHKKSKKNFEKRSPFSSAKSKEPVRNRKEQKSSYSQRPSGPGKNHDQLTLIMKKPEYPDSLQTKAAPVQATTKQKKSLLDFLLERGANNRVSDRKGTTDRKDSKKRGTNEDDRRSVRKTRPKKSHR